MNAPATFEADNLPVAIERANRWIDTARPIIAAYVHMDDEVTGALRTAQLADKTSWTPRRSASAQAWEEARQIIEEARNELFYMLDGIRDNFCSDQMLPQPADDDEDAWTARDEADNAVRAACLSVKDAVKLVEREMFPGWGA